MEQNTCLVPNSSLSNLDLDNRACLRFGFVWSIILSGLYAILFLIGIIGNLLLIVVLTCKARMRRSSANLFILKVVLENLILICFCLPINLTTIVVTPWILGDLTCRLATYIQEFIQFSSVYTLVAVALERCLAAYSPEGRIYRYFTNRQIILIIFSIWTISSIIYLPSFFIRQIVLNPIDDLPYCQQVWSLKSLDAVYFLGVNFGCTFVMPPILINIFIKFTLQSLGERCIQTDCYFPSILIIHWTEKHSVLKMVSALIIVYTLSWLPFYVVVLLIKIPVIFGSQIDEESESNLLQDVSPTFQLMGIMWACLNPVIYTVFNANFREVVKSSLQNILGCCFPCFRERGRRRFSSQRAFPESRFQSRISHSRSVPSDLQNIDNAERQTNNVVEVRSLVNFPSTRAQSSTSSLDTTSVF